MESTFISNFKYRTLKDIEHYESALDRSIQVHYDGNEEFLNRIFAFHSLTSKSANYCAGGGKCQWDDILDNNSYIEALLDAQDKEKLKEVFMYPSKHTLFRGFDDNDRIDIECFWDNGQNLKFSRVILDALLRFACAINAKKLPNPEGFFEDKVLIENVIDRIEEKLNQELSFPETNGVFGLPTKRGIVTFRAAQALYQSWRINELCKNIENPKILEIGAGLGRNAYFCKKMYNLENFTIVDLPLTNISQTLFLTYALGKENIVLYGEDFKNSENKTKILPFEIFLDENYQEKYDLIINIDSITEMKFGTAQQYWEKIENYSSKFLSINHDCNGFTMNTLHSQSNKIKNYYKYPYWLRRGYAEEIFEF